MFKKENSLFIIALVLIFVAVAGVWFLSKQKTKSHESEDIASVSHIKGNPNAEAKLVEYSDLECPACASFHVLLKPLLEKLGDNISFEYKHFPLTSLHPKAISAAIAAEAAGKQGKFFEFHDWLFENRSEWIDSKNTEVVFVKQAEKLGLDTVKFKADLKAKSTREKVLADRDEALKLKLNGTPSFFLNGEKMEFKTLDEFVRQIAEAIGVSSDDLLVTEPKAESEEGKNKAN